MAWRLVSSTGSASLDRYGGKIEAIKLIGLASIFLVGWRIGTEPSARIRAVRLLVWAASAYAVIGLLVQFCRPIRLMFGLSPIPPIRFNATFASANSAGAAFGVFAVLALVIFVDANLVGPRRSRLFTLKAIPLTRLLTKILTPLLILWFALICTGSRAAIGATVLATTGVILLMQPSMANILRGAVAYKRGYILAAAAALIWPAVAALFADVMTKGSITGNDFSDRHAIYQMMIEAARSRPLLGYGLGSYRAVNDHFATGNWTSNAWTLSAGHNLYLQWWLEAGLIGATLIFTLIAYLLVLVSKMAVSNSSPTALAVLGASLVLLFHNTFDFSLQIYMIAGLWTFLLGLSAAPDIAYGDVGSKSLSRASTAATA